MRDRTNLIFRNINTSLYSILTCSTEYYDRELSYQVTYLNEILSNKLSMDDFKDLLCDKTLFKIKYRDDIKNVLKDINYPFFSNVRQIENNITCLYHYIDYLSDDELLMIEELQDIIYVINSINELEGINEAYKDASLMRNTSLIYDISIFFKRLSLLLVDREIKHTKRNSDNKIYFDIENKIKTYYFNGEYKKCLSFIKKTEKKIKSDQQKILCMKFKIHCLSKLNKNKKKQELFKKFLDEVNGKAFYFKDKLLLEHLDDDMIKLLKITLLHDFDSIMNFNNEISEARKNQIRKAKQIRLLLE